MSTEKFYIDFSQNWKDKLNNNIFSTIRLFNPNKYKQGRQYIIRYKNEEILKAELDRISPVFYLQQLPSIAAKLDTGYSKEETIKIFENIYKNADFDINTKLFQLYQFKVVKRYINIEPKQKAS